MALRAGHGTGKGQPRIEVMPPDELPQPVPAVPDVTEPSTGVDRRQDGTVATPEAARVLGARGGRARARIALASGLALRGRDGLKSDFRSHKAFKSYEKAAAYFRRVHTAELARLGGGVCGSGPSSMVASAALALAASRFLYSLAAAKADPGLFKQASQLANDSRQNLMAAYEMVVREAKARETAVDPQNDPFLRLLRGDDDKGEQK